MNELSNQGRAVELLQQLGLKEYEARCFVALSRRPQGTAKEISELSEVPRTRVYDAIRVLETKGLVEIQHANPQVFRAMSVDEAVETLRSEYESRVEALGETLRNVEPAATDGDGDVTQEVWALSGETAISNRMNRLLGEAEREVVLVLGHEAVFTDALRDDLTAADERGVSVIVGTNSQSLRERVRDALPEAEVFLSELEWLGSAPPGDDTEIIRLLLIDRNTILVSTRDQEPDADEHAVFGRGFGNGLVAITRRLMATGLLPVDDPG